MRSTTRRAQLAFLWENGGCRLSSESTCSGLLFLLWGKQNSEAQSCRLRGREHRGELPKERRSLLSDTFLAFYLRDMPGGQKTPGECLQTSSLVCWTHLFLKCAAFLCSTGTSGFLLLNTTGFLPSYHLMHSVDLCVLLGPGCALTGSSSSECSGKHLKSPPHPEEAQWDSQRESFTHSTNSS